MLIYLEPELQQRVLAAFHYALNPRGFLMLGRAEGASALGDQFSVVDKQQRIFVRNEGTALPSLQVGGVRPRQRNGARGAGAAGSRSGRLAAAELPGQADRMLLARYAPAGVIVDESLRILEFRGDTAPFLEHPHGQAGLGLLRMARRACCTTCARPSRRLARMGAPVLAKGRAAAGGTEAAAGRHRGDPAAAGRPATAAACS